MTNVEEYIKAGYKLTPLGLIPSDWAVKTIGEAYEICNNLRLPISEEERNKIKGEYPYYGPTKIQDYINEYRLEGTYALIGEDGDHFLKWKELPMTLLVKGKFNVNNHAHIILGKENLTEWFFYFFNQRELTPHLTRQGAGRYKLSKGSLSKILCALPPISEQKAIAKVLGLMDSAINTNNQLIAQKELHKKWLMQSLLTGVKRLYGFKEPWQEVELASIGHIPSKTPITKIENQKLLTVKLYAKGIEFNSKEKPIISKTGRPYYERKLGEILVGRQNIHNGGIGLVSKEFDLNICSNAITSYSVDENEHSILFILYYLQFPANYKRIEDFMGGTGQKELSERDFLKLKIFIPRSLNEEKAIVQVISAANNEIQLLKAKSEKLRELKKGLMQVLLTGKKRLKI